MFSDIQLETITDNFLNIIASGHYEILEIREQDWAPKQMLLIYREFGKSLCTRLQSIVIAHARLTRNLLAPTTVGARINP